MAEGFGSALNMDRPAQQIFYTLKCIAAHAHLRDCLCWLHASAPAWQTDTSIAWGLILPARNGPSGIQQGCMESVSQRALSHTVILTIPYAHLTIPYGHLPTPPHSPIPVPTLIPRQDRQHVHLHVPGMNFASNNHQSLEWFCPCGMCAMLAMVNAPTKSRTCSRLDA